MSPDVIKFVVESGSVMLGTYILYIWLLTWTSFLGVCQAARRTGVVCMYCDMGSQGRIHGS